MTDPVSNVRIGNSAVPNNTASFKNGEKPESNAPNVDVQNNFEQAKPDDMLNALNLAGMQNLAFISKPETKEINPMDHLSEDRIGDIEAMMAEFEAGVNDIANVIEGEFPEMFTDAQKNALAAQIFAAE